MVNQLWETDDMTISSSVWSLKGIDW